VTATVVPLLPRRGRRRRPLVPFTVEHFRVWGSRLVYDDGGQRDPEDWQLDFGREVFRGISAPYLRSDWAVREAWLLVPEGNGKTTFVSLLCLYCAEWSIRPWIPVGASTRPQAKTLYTQAKGFVQDTPGLSRGFECMDGYLSILPLDYRTGERRPGRGIEITPWDPSSNDGVIPWPIFVCDELHRHPDMSLWRLWKGKARKRRAVGVGISTAGAPGEEFEESRDKVRQGCRRIRKQHGGTLYRGSYMAMWEYRLADPEKANDPVAVAAVNPLSLVTAEVMAEELESPTLDFGEFKRLKCNIPSRSSWAAITDEEWAAARLDVSAAEQAEMMEGQRCDAGLDLGWKIDTTALVAELTLPEFKLLDEAQVAVPPRDSTSLHPDRVKELLYWRMERNPIDTLVMDMTDGEDVAAWAADELGIDVVDRPKGNDLAVVDYKHFMRDLRAHEPQWKIVEVKVPGAKYPRKVRQRLLPLRIVRSCPLLTRHSMNAVARRLPRGDIRFDRPTSSRGSVRKQDTRVIDALDAAGMVNTHTNRPPEQGFDLGAFRIQPT
jgi:hypothetical protein